MRKNRRTPSVVGRRSRDIEKTTITIRSFSPPRLRIVPGGIERVRYPLIDAPVTGTVARVRWIERREA